MANLDLELEQKMESQKVNSLLVERAFNKPTPTQGETVAWPKLNAFERLVIRRAHPRSLFINAAGALWLFYYLAQHDWMMALLMLVAFRVAAYASVWNVDPNALAQTTLGKIALLHLHPLNLVVQTAGLIPMLYGVWQHSVELILVGLTFVFLGHFFGWSRVDRRFKVRR